MSNDRKSARRKSLKGALAAFNNRHSTIPCTVRDISETGCRVCGPTTVNIPDTFELIIELDGFVAPCEVVWRRDQSAGVRFTAAPGREPAKRMQVVKAVVPGGMPSLRKRPKVP